ncbi:MAG: hypothetical protein WCA46_05185 [Actinocatenispora sp.]
MSEESLADSWRRIILGDDKSWVAFAHGTCVVLPTPKAGADLAAQAVGILREYGPVLAGTPAGDFGTITLDPGPGWVVWSHHPDVLTYVGPDEAADDPGDLAVGMLGRFKRDQDSRVLEVVHVEDRRPT